MGIGIDGDTINENLKLATGALDLALGRGGDQAVVKTKDKFAFYGPHTYRYRKIVSKVNFSYLI